MKYRKTRFRLKSHPATCPVLSDIIYYVAIFCPSRYPLHISGTREDRFLIPLDTAKKEIFRYRVRLPPYVTCTQCVLQWTYYTGEYSRLVCVGVDFIAFFCLYSKRLC